MYSICVIKVYVMHTGNSSVYILSRITFTCIIHMYTVYVTVHDIVLCSLMEFISSVAHLTPPYVFGMQTQDSASTLSQVLYVHESCIYIVYTFGVKLMNKCEQ